MVMTKPVVANVLGHAICELLENYKLRKYLQSQDQADACGNTGAVQTRVVVFLVQSVLGNIIETVVP